MSRRPDHDDVDPDGELGADTMIGGAGNDTYGVDDLLDVVVEAAGREPTGSKPAWPRSRSSPWPTSKT